MSLDQAWRNVHWVVRHKVGRLLSIDYWWGLTQTNDGHAAPMITTPGGDLPFQVSSVAIDGAGDVFVGGSGLGTFDGSPNISASSWDAGWLTYFYVPAP